MKYLKYLVVSGLTLADSALAQGAGLVTPQRPTGLPGSSNNTVTGVLFQYLQYFLAIIGIVTVVFIIIGGFRYITSAGNEEAAESGKKTLTNAIIGLVVVILSYIIVTVIINALAYQQV